MEILYIANFRNTCSIFVFVNEFFVTEDFTMFSLLYLKSKGFDFEIEKWLCVSCVFFFLSCQQTKSHTAELRAKPEYHKFLIGKGGGNIRKVRDSTGARIIFPAPDDKDQELITVVGTEEAVREAQKELEELIKSLVRIQKIISR